MKQTYVAIAVAAAAVLAGCGDKKSKATDEGPMPVTVAVPVVDSITLYKSYPGFLSSHLMVDVVCQVNGRLLSKTYTSGAFVRQGQVLFQIDPTLYRDQVSEAEASLATARSSYDYYSRQYAAMQKALEADAVSQMDVIQARSNMEKAEAAIKQSQAQLNTARTNLGYCTIRAPKDGYITSATIDPGNYVSGAGQPVTLATIYDNDYMVAVFSVEASQYVEMMKSISDTTIYVPLKFETPMKGTYAAHLYYVDPTVARNTGTITLKGTVPNKEQELKNSMYITAMLPYGTNPRAVLVKDASIGKDQSGSYLYTVNDSDRVVYTHIETGDIYHDSMRLVTKGITPQTRYVTSALLKVRDGMTVKPMMK